MASCSRQTNPLPLTPEQEAEAQRRAELMHQATKGDFLQRARLLVSKPDEQLFGQTEFQVRDRAHGLTARAFQQALDQRAKKKTT